jgi:hypothetical protein
MLKTTVYGLPLNPAHLLNQLQGGSFCVSYATRDKLGRQLDQAIELVGQDGLLLVDNGAFSLWRKGGDSFSEEYVEGFEAWAQAILDRCPQAVAVIPDVIGGSEEINIQRIHECQLDWDRCMPIWHLNDSIEFLLYLVESGFNYIGFGSAGEDYKAPGTDKWHRRMAEAFAAIDAFCAESEGAYVRPRIHLMRAQAFAHLYPVDSADSTNVAVNHNRWRRTNKVAENHVAKLAATVDARIQASAGPEAEHQSKRPLLYHLEAARIEQRWQLLARLEVAGLYAAADALDGCDTSDPEAFAEAALTAELALASQPRELVELVTTVAGQDVVVQIKLPAGAVPAAADLGIPSFLDRRRAA